MKILELLGTATLAFTAVKMTFVAVQWVFEDKSDPILRKQLDSFYDRLDRLSLRQLALRLLVRSLRAASKWLPNHGRPSWRLGLVFFSINIFAYVIGQGIYCYQNNDCGFSLGHYDVVVEFGLPRLLLWFALAFSASTLVQLLSLWIVWRLMGVTATRFGWRRAIFGLAFCILVLISLFLLQYAIQQYSRLFAFELPIKWERLVTHVQNRTPYFWATTVLAISAGIPLVVYTIALAVSVLIRAMPSFARAGLMWLIFRITTDNTPVLERVGSVAGGIASLSSALSGYLRA